MFIEAELSLQVSNDLKSHTAVQSLCFLWQRVSRSGTMGGNSCAVSY